MKKIIILTLLLMPALSQAQSYSIDWYKIAGGGGTSAGTNGGAIYAVSGTVGQQDAGTAMSGGPFSLTGGYWSLIALVQSPGGPTLSIELSNKQAVVSWPYPSTGYVLQTNGNLASTNWQNYTGAVVTNSGGSGSNNVTLTPPVGHWFFRLGP